MTSVITEINSWDSNFNSTIITDIDTVLNDNELRLTSEIDSSKTMLKTYITAEETYLKNEIEDDVFKSQQDIISKLDEEINDWGDQIRAEINADELSLKTNATADITTNAQADIILLIQTQSTSAINTIKTDLIAMFNDIKSKISTETD